MRILNCVILSAILSLACDWALHGQNAGGIFQFREPRLGRYAVQANQLQSSIRDIDARWLPVVSMDHPDLRAEMGDRLTLKLKNAAESNLEELIGDRPLELSRTIEPGLFILQAPDAWTCAAQAEALAQREEVEVSCPVMKREKRVFGSVAPVPNDPLFQRQWNLEHRDEETGEPLGPELNIRPAWSQSMGEGVHIAIVDDGVDFNHPDLSARMADLNLHYDFTRDREAVLPLGSLSVHGTAVAGLASSEINNGIGITGVAPKSKLVSWIIFQGVNFLVSDEDLMDMFQNKTNTVFVQNHSWGNAIPQQLTISALEDAAIENAVTRGRGGKGVILVRAAGNSRDTQGNANDDGYLADPRVIPVAAIRKDGLAARFSNPGANILVAAPSGDFNAQLEVCLPAAENIITTDRPGTLGFNTRPNAAEDDSNNYVSDGSFIGTSASAPQISGLAALILSVNPDLGYRDVQQVLLMSARHLNLNDPDKHDPEIQINGAGFPVSNNLGYGLPDANLALRLARQWVNRPSKTNLTYSVIQSKTVPDQGLRVALEGEAVPVSLSSLPCIPSLGYHVQDGSPLFPLVDVGEATEPIEEDLTGKAALIRRAPAGASTDSVHFFCQKIENARAAGAALAIIYNSRNGDELIAMGGTESVRIPAVFLSQNNGEPVRDLLASGEGVSAGLALNRIEYEIDVPDSLLCEHVELKVNAVHTGRGDLRIVLESPAGTRSVMQTVGPDTTLGPNNWTYVSVQHFYESSQGVWKVHVSDEDVKGSGRVTLVELNVHGVPIEDEDADGLDDGWETRHFGDLAAGPRDDPDFDGNQNAKEQILATDPNAVDARFELNVTPWNAGLARLSWPSSPEFVYFVMSGTDLNEPLEEIARVPGKANLTEWFTETPTQGFQFFSILARRAGL